MPSPKTHRSQVQRGYCPKGLVVTINCYRDETGTRYVVFHDKRAIQTFRQLEQAQQLYKDVCTGGYTAPTVRLDDWDGQADLIERSPNTAIAELRYPLLAALNRRKHVADKRSKSHLNFNGLVARKVGAEEIPSDPTDIEKWLQGDATKPGAIARILEGAKSQSTARMRITFFLQCLRQMEEYPLVFSRYVGLIPQAKAATRRLAQRQARDLRPIEHYPPFTRKQIEAMLGQRALFTEVCLALFYLAGGWRGGEAEHVTRDDMLPGNVLDMAAIQSKTRGRRKKVLAQAPAPLVTRAILELMYGRVWPVLVDVERKRFRATCATWTSLAGMPTLLIAARLGHTSKKMSDEHYARPEFVKACLAGHGSAQAALFTYDSDLIEFEADGLTRENLDENWWDWWLLFQLCTQARRFDKADEVRAALRGVIEGRKETKKKIVSF